MAEKPQCQSHPQRVEVLQEEEATKGTLPWSVLRGAQQWRGVASAAGAVTTAAALFVTTHYQNFDSRVSTLKKFHVHTCKFQDECGLYYIFIK